MRTSAKYRMTSSLASPSLGGADIYKNHVKIYRLITVLATCIPMDVSVMSDILDTLAPGLTCKLN